MGSSFHLLLSSEAGNLSNPGPDQVLVTCGKRRVSDLALVVGKLGKREDKSKDGVKKRRRRGT